ncbi:hypothetical protein BH10CYA1_BH10CYA1_04090 [soil metagenome]
MDQEHTGQKISAEETVLQEEWLQPPENIELVVSTDAQRGKLQIENSQDSNLQDLYQLNVHKQIVKRRKQNPRFYTNDFLIDAEHGWFVSLAIAGILFFLAATMCVVCFASVVAWPSQLDWPAVEGQVVEIKPFSKMSGRFTFTYEVDGHTYTSSIDKPDSLEHTVKIGQKVTVRYNPKRISESVMQGGFNVVETPFYVLAALGLFFSSLIYASGRMIRKPSQEQGPGNRPPEVSGVPTAP